MKVSRYNEKNNFDDTGYNFFKGFWLVYDQKYKCGDVNKVVLTKTLCRMKSNDGKCHRLPNLIIYTCHIKNPKYKVSRRNKRCVCSKLYGY